MRKYGGKLDTSNTTVIYEATLSALFELENGIFVAKRNSRKSR
jgi:hypothetical protein